MSYTLDVGIHASNALKSHTAQLLCASLIFVSFEGYFS